MSQIARLLHALDRSPDGCVSALADLMERFGDTMDLTPLENGFILYGVIARGDNLHAQSGVWIKEARRVVAEAAPGAHARASSLWRRLRLGGRFARGRAALVG